MVDLKNWKGVAPPEKRVIEGLYARLEPLDTAAHAHSLFESATAEGIVDRFRYLIEEPPKNFEEFNNWANSAAALNDPIFFAVIDKTTGRAEGRQSFMRIDPVHGVIEIGHIMWGPAIARTRVTTEALFLLADHAFNLGYRRLEWKCNDLNLPSKCAAERFGFKFEGVFRQHMVVKGQSRDTAWFSIIDSDWPRIRAGYERWLAPDNFDGSGQQLKKLTL